MLWSVLDSTGSRYNSAVCSCEPSSFIKGGEFLDYLNQLVTEFVSYYKVHAGNGYVRTKTVFKTLVI
jgi:hypothetical protein